jgi:oligopeptide transport system substrate-binding protein
MKKKLLCTLLASVMVLSTMLTGCGNNTATDANNTTVEESETVVTDDNSDSAETDEATEATETTGSKELAVVVGPEPDTIDPALNSAVDGGTLIVHAFEGLMTLDENASPVAGQAESWDISEDGLTYTFHLRDGLKWSDDSDLVASDFVYSWNRAIAPETAADYEYMFDCIEGYAEGELNVTAVDDKTLEVKLVTATPYFLELCAFPAYAPVKEDIVEADPDGWTLSPETYVGNGPYKMASWDHNSQIVMVKNPNYWNAENVVADQITFKLMEDDSAQLAAYENGEVVMIDSVPNDEIPTLESRDDYHVVGQLGTYYISFNTQDEILSNPLVRKALTLAIDRTYIVEEIGQAGQEEAGAFVPIGLSDADPAKEFRAVGGDYYDAYDYEANLELAKEALAEAGYPDGEGLPVIEYLYNEGTGHQLIGEALQNMWSKIGVNVELTSQEWGTFLNTRKEGDYQIARNGWLGDYNDPISFLDMWVTGGGNNDAQWSNAEYDQLISDIKSTSDQSERMSKMHAAEDIIFDEWMLCPIYYYTDIYMINSNVKGFYASKLGFKYFMYASVE